MTAPMLVPPRPARRQIVQWFASVLLALGTAAPAVAATVTPPPVYGHPDARGNPTSMDGFKLESSGTGFYVSMQGHFVTAFHVAGHCSRLAVLRPDGPYAAKVVAMDSTNDVAVVQTAPPKSAAALTVGAGLPKDTPLKIERTWHLGGLASRSSLVAHYLGAIANHPPVDFAVRAQQAVVGGNSGSPVMRMQGAVAGMVDAVISKQPTITLVIDSRRIADVLQRAGISFVWRSENAKRSGPPGVPVQFTFPIACYVGPPSPESQ